MDDDSTYQEACSGFVARRGNRWGGAAMEWARLNLEYGGPLIRGWKSADLEVLLWGKAASWKSPEGFIIWGMPANEIESRPLEEFFRDGSLAPELALDWPYHQFVCVNPEQDEVEVVLGRFYPRGSFYAERHGDVLFAPQQKAFCDVRSLRTVHAFPRGHRIVLRPSSHEVRFEKACSEPGEPDEFPVYEEAVAECRARFERSLDAALAGNKEPYALSLSGGLDSSILATLLAKRGLRPPAFNVWFDLGGNEPPRDIVLARRIASHLGFELHEVRLELKDLRTLVLETLSVGEPATLPQAENSLYHLPLLRELRARGYPVRLTGNGIDNAFAGYAHFRKAISEGTFRSLYLEILEGAKTRHIAAFNGYVGVRSLEPFRSTPLIRFALSLPQAFLVESDKNGFRGKRIVRDAFLKDLPAEILEQDKKLPGAVNDAAAMLSRLFGGEGPKQAALLEICAELQTFPDLRRVPAWAVRSFRGGQLLRRRERRAKLALERRARG